MSDCLFCKIIAREVPFYPVYEDDTVLGFLDIGPVSRGHVQFIPKQHAENLSSGSVEDAAALMRAVHAAAPLFLERLGASAYNLGMNSGADAGQIVFHTHLHFMPRYAGQERTFTKTHPNAQELTEIAQIMRGGEDGVE